MKRSEANRKVNNQRFLQKHLNDPIPALSSLTDEQRRAVIIDEDNNLVVAPAGSGKTSVIVAKAGYLIDKHYRHPSELLLLAFARNARKELEERLRTRLGNYVADNLTVQTFHKLGMAIIGDVEGKLPTLSKVAEDERALHDLLKKIMVDLVAEGQICEALLNWFKSNFAPYRSRHEFKNWGEYRDYIRSAH